MKAMIFAAGKGTRLGKITEKTPKALLRINGKSALQNAVEKVTAHGFDDIIVNIHHHPHLMIEEINRLRSLGYRIEISDETENLLETGGGLYNAKWFFDDNTPFLLYNVDIITDLNLSDLYNFHKSHNAIATLAVMKRNDTRYFLTGNDGILRGWCNTETGEEIITGKEEPFYKAAFTGIHVADPAIFSYMSDGVYSMTGLYLKISGEIDVQTCIFECKWIDIGSEESLKAAGGDF
ncbi:MAG TPA: sugar phosphate nucleotidyltransferase [Bacteroidales bacterium]|nr:sugar phosphate nucleotidyltransferase [Bacteroidales bacterium]